MVGLDYNEDDYLEYQITPYGSLYLWLRKHGLKDPENELLAELTKLGYMTGQEWYDRFMEELEEIEGFWPMPKKHRRGIELEKARKGLGALARADIYEAARRAAGLEEK